MFDYAFSNRPSWVPQPNGTSTSLQELTLPSKELPRHFFHSSNSQYDMRLIWSSSMDFVRPWKHTFFIISMSGDDAAPSSKLMSSQKNIWVVSWVPSSTHFEGCHHVHASNKWWSHPKSWKHWFDLWVIQVHVHCVTTCPMIHVFDITHSWHLPCNRQNHLCMGPTHIMSVLPLSKGSLYPFMANPHMGNTQSIL